MGILSVDIFIRFDKALKWTDFAQNEGNKKITMTDCKQNKTFYLKHSTRAAVTEAEIVQLGKFMDENNNCAETYVFTFVHFFLNSII